MKKLKENSIAFEMLNDLDEKAETKQSTKKQATQKAPSTNFSEAQKPYKETKSKHLQLLIKPSTFTKLKQASTMQGQSVNEYINNLLESTLGD